MVLTLSGCGSSSRSSSRGGCSNSRSSTGSSNDGFSNASNSSSSSNISIDIILQDA